MRRRELASMRRIPTVQTINPPVQGPDVFLAIPSCPPPPRLSLPAPLISSSAFITYPRHTRSLPHTLRLFARPAHCSSLPYRLGTLLADTASRHCQPTPSLRQTSSSSPTWAPCACHIPAVYTFSTLPRPPGTHIFPHPQPPPWVSSKSSKPVSPATMPQTRGG